MINKLNYLIDRTNVGFDVFSMKHCCIVLIWSKVLMLVEWDD